MESNKQHKNLNVPTLRFPGFTDEWQKAKIGTLATKVGSGSTPRGGSAIYQDQGHPFVRSQNVGNGVLLLEEIAHISDEIHAQQKNTEIKINDVLLNITGASIGRCAVADFRIAGGNVNQHVCIIRTEQVNPIYLSNLILSNRGQRQIDSFQAGGNREGLNFEQVKSIKIYIPKKEEQNKISVFLKLLDERIATQSKIIERLESLITGLNNYLDNHIEKSIEVSFSEIAVDYNGLSGKSGDDFGNGYPYIPYVSVNAKNEISDNSKFPLVNVCADEKQNSVMNGDLLVTLSSETPEEVAVCASYIGGQYPMYLNSFCFGLHFSQSHLAYPPYFGFFANTTRFRRMVYPLAQGSTRYNLHKQDFMKTKFVLPTPVYQERIYRTLQLYTSRLKTEMEILSCLYTQKEFMVSNLFI